MQSRLWRIIAAGMLSFALSGCPRAAQTPDHVLIQALMEPVIANLDSPAYAVSVPWGDHVVLCFRAAQGRDPSLVEFATLRMMREHPGLKRSEVLGLALAAESDTLDWTACRDFLASKTTDAFATNDAVRLKARALAARPAKELAAELADDDAAVEPADKSLPLGTQVPDEAYNTYFGFLHTHSHFSLDADQSGTIDEAYTVARDQAGLDFMGVTDHAEFLILWPWDHKWERGLAAADAHNAPGEFVALYGFEWSNPVLGHVSVMNTDEFTHSLKTFRFQALLKWLEAHPDAYAQLNHPGDFDFIGLEFGHLRHAPRAVAQVMGMEQWNTNVGFDRYYYAGSWESDVPYIDVANQRGWMLGALGAQDNHKRDWGLLNDFRTGVLATELTRQGLAEAFRARRFYATEDKDLLLDFRCSGYPMGARLDGVARNFTITVTDGSGDAFQEARFFKNGQPLAMQALEGASDIAEFSDAGATGYDYYYVIVTQTDDNDNNGRNDEALSSPIWANN
ncbi:MAG: DUF3604 domain-containing protein [Candidatus Hydrogenedens sp.]|nr:DUF3604 domain-containing protein [Candidatus Hydrogenedens sp.]